MLRDVLNVAIGIVWTVPEDAKEVHIPDSILLMQRA
jgi:hypothetical protein